MSGFGWKHYVPVLKWKRAERKAIRELSPEQKKLMTPIFQLVPPKPKASRGGQRGVESQLEEIEKGVSDELQRVAKEISEDWGPTSAFLDAGLLYSPEQRAGAVSQVLTHASSSGLILTPIVNISADASEMRAVGVAAKKNGSGICIRLTRSHFAAPTTDLGELLRESLALSGFSAEDTAIVVDLQVVDENDPDYHQVIRATQSLPQLEKWKSLTVVAGSFPKDLTKCSVDEKNYCNRTEWENWMVYAQSQKLKRTPSFGDYTIQHPIFIEQLQFFLPSKSIKYAVDGKWLIMRGTKKGPSNQYLAHAQLLSRDEQYVADYFGRDYSFGDNYIFLMGENVQGKKTGNAETWLAAGINHHLVCTAMQVAGLA